MTPETLHHYVIVREDLPPGTKLAMTIHAAGESAMRPIPEGTYAYCLSVPDEGSLRSLSEKLRNRGCPHVLIFEPDPPYDGQAMAIGCVPTEDRTKIRRLTGHLPLAR